MSRATRSYPDWYVHQSLQDATTPSRVVQYVREELQCDRVSLLLRRGKRWRVVEVSGIAKIHRHSQTIRAIERSASTLLGPGELLSYPSERELSPIEDKAIDRLLDATGANAWLLIPLQGNQARDIGEARKPESAAPWMALFCERFEGDRFDPAYLPIQELAMHSSIAVSNWKFLQSIPGGKVTRWIARMLGAGAKWKVAFGAIVLALALLATCLVQTTHWVEVSGRLVPVTVQNLYAPSSATVSSVLVRHGQMVSEGDLLIELNSSQLKQLEREISGQMQVSQQQLLALKSQQLSAFGIAATPQPSGAPNGSVQNSQFAEIRQLEASIENLEAQLQLLRADLDKLEMRAPFAGRVTTWNLQERFQQRPVRTGDWLLTLEAVENQTWKLELELPPRAVGAVLEARHERSEIAVRFRVGSMPEKEWNAKLLDVGTSTQVDAGVSVVLRGVAEVVSIENQVDWQSGTEVRAMVDCGRTSVFKAWTHDLVHWWNYRVAFYFASVPERKDANK